MSTPIEPINLPLIGPTPIARPVTRRVRSGDDDRQPPGRHEDERPRREDAETDEENDGFPHVDVRA